MKIFFLCLCFFISTFIPYHLSVRIRWKEHFFLWLLVLNTFMMDPGSKFSFWSWIEICILIGVYYQDIITYYFSWPWLLCFFILLAFPIQDILSAFISLGIYGGISGLIYILSKDWIGIADVFFIFGYSFSLGLERMTIALLCACLFGCMFCIFYKKKCIPFLSMLAIGVIIARVYGYTIWYYLIGFI